MVKAIRNSGFFNGFITFLALYMLNCSIDSPDNHPNFVAEDLTFNDQESIVELVVEIILGFDETIPEYEDNDNHKHTVKKIRTIDLYSSSLHHFTLIINAYTKNSYSFLRLFFKNPFLEIKHPPPKTV